MRPSLIVVTTLFLAAVHAAVPIVGLSDENTIPDNYIVVLKKEISNKAFKSHLSWARGLFGSNSIPQGSTFELNAFKGYSLQASQDVAKAPAESEEASRLTSSLTHIVVILWRATCRANS